MSTRNEKLNKELRALKDGLKSNQDELVNFVNEVYGYKTINHKVDYTAVPGLGTDDDERPVDILDVGYYVFGCYFYSKEYRKPLLKSIPKGICSPLPRDFDDFVRIANLGYEIFLEMGYERYKKGL